MQTKLVQQACLGMVWLVLGLVINLVGAQENPAGAQQGVKLVETRADDHSNNNEPPRDKRFFTFSGVNGPMLFQPTVPFESLHNYVQQQNQFRGRDRSRNFANNQHLNTFCQMMSSPQFGGFNGRGINQHQGNMLPWGYSGDWSQWGWPNGNGFGGQPYGSWNQNFWGRYGQNRPWNQFGGNPVSGPRSQFGGGPVCGPWSQFGGGLVSGPWSQFGGRPVIGPWGQSRGRGRPGQQGGYRPGYGYGYGYPFIRR